MKNRMKRMTVFVAGIALLSTTFGGAVHAAMVGTQSAVDREQRAEYVSEIRDWLAQDNVEQELIELGVDPGQAAERIAALTNEELRTLHERISDLPAGGVVEVIGVVFVVFIILELLGVTNVFTGF